MSFEGFLVQKGDEIDNAAYTLAVALLKSDPDEDDEKILPWDMSIIGEINEVVSHLLSERGYQSCYPYYSDEVPCIKGNDCKNAKCCFRKDGTE